MAVGFELRSTRLFRKMTPVISISTTYKSGDARTNGDENKPCMKTKAAGRSIILEEGNDSELRLVEEKGKAGNLS